MVQPRGIWMRYMINVSALKGGAAIVYVLFFAVIFAGTAHGLPSATFVSPTASDNATAFLNWTFINITSGEDLNQSFIEWGNASGFTNMSMTNESAYIRNRYFNMSNLTDGTYNYTIWMENTTGGWNQSERRYITVDTVAPYNISACQSLTAENGNYILVQNVSSSGTCFTILANNVTLDGAGYVVNYSKSATGYAINNSLGYSSTTIKNANIAQGSASAGAHTIYFKSSSGGRIFNNTITTYGPESAGIYLNASSSTNVTGGSIVANGGSAYYLENSGTTNNFTGTGFTALRNITFADTASYFNYNNDSSKNIWLKTNISAASSINRTLTNWTNHTVQWNETNSTAGIVANYTITGLAPSANYKIYNTSNGVQTNSYNLTTDASGALSAFAIALSGNTEIKVLEGTPIITINYPANGAILNFAPYINGTVFGSSIHTIRTNISYYNATYDTDGSPFNFTNITIPNGTYTINVSANDTYGNVVWANVTFTIDMTPPAFSSSPVHSAVTSSSAYVAWTSDGPTNYTLRCGGNPSSTSSSYENNGFQNKSCGALTASTTYYYNVTICDQAGNCVTSDTSSFTTSASDSGSSTSAASSGSGGASSSTVKSWSYIAGGATATMAISSSSIYLTLIEVTVNQAVSNAKLTVSRFTSKPASTATAPEGTAYQYLSITPENLPESKITGADITFKVSTKWMSDNNIDSNKITLYRYSGGSWNALTTASAKGSTSEYTYYVADTPGFSYFLIAGKVKSAATTTTTKKNTTTTNVTSGSTTASNQTSAGIENNSTQNASQSNITSGNSVSSASSSIFAVIAVLLVAGVGAYYYKTKQPTKWKTEFKSGETKPEEKKSALVQLPKPQYNYKFKPQTKNTQILDLIKETVNAPKKKIQREEKPKEDAKNK